MSMLLAVGILFLSNMAFAGRPSYEEILMKAKNGQLPAPDDSGVNLADSVPPSVVSSLSEPPEFDDLPSSPECPWTALDFLGMAMLGSLGTAVILCCIFLQRKFRCLF